MADSTKKTIFSNSADRAVISTSCLQGLSAQLFREEEEGGREEGRGLAGGGKGGTAGLEQWQKNTGLMIVLDCRDTTK